MQSDMTERRNTLCSVFGLKRQTTDFHEFNFIVLYFVAIGPFTTDGGLLQPTGCKDNTSKDPFSQCESLHGIRVQVKIG